MAGKGLKLKIVLVFVLTAPLSFSASMFPINPANASGTGWQVQMMVSGKKTTLTASRQTSLGSPGSSTFPSITSSSTSASSRSVIGNGEGLYSAFFTQT